MLFFNSTNPSEVSLNSINKVNRYYRVLMRARLGLCHANVTAEKIEPNLQVCTIQNVRSQRRLKSHWYTELG